MYVISAGTTKSSKKAAATESLPQANKQHVSPLPVNPVNFSTSALHPRKQIVRGTYIRDISIRSPSSYPAQQRKLSNLLHFCPALAHRPNQLLKASRQRRAQVSIHLLTPCWPSAGQNWLLLPFLVLVSHPSNIRKNNTRAANVLSARLLGNAVT